MNTLAAPAVKYLHVPYREKDEAKALGARWDAARRMWYAPRGSDLARFRRWAFPRRPRCRVNNGFGGVGSVGMGR